MDRLAKEALNFNVLDLKILYTDFKVNVPINNVFKQNWQAMCPEHVHGQTCCLSAMT